MTLKQYRNLIEKKIILSHESSLLEKQIKENDSRIEKICQKINISKNNIKYIWRTVQNIPLKVLDKTGGNFVFFV